MAEQIGVIFDMDGVLVDSARPHLKSWQMLGEEQGVSITQDQFAATFGRGNEDIIPILFGDASADLIRELADRKEELYRELVRGRAPVVPGAIDLVCGLESAGVKLAVGSSAPLENIELILDAMDVRDLISEIVSADDVTRGKPDPEVFSTACHRLALPPHRCVVVEDAPAGVLAGKAAGAKVIGVLIHHSEADLAGADQVVSKLADLDVQRVIDLAKY